MNRATGLLALGGMLLSTFVLVTGAAQVPPRASGAAFTPDRPESQGLSGAAMARLTDELNRLVSEQRTIGVELVVLKNRRIVLQAVAGWRDRESGARMDGDTIFSLRSLTKPLVGLAAEVLIDQGKLALADKVSRYLPAFAAGPEAAITVEHLLTQRSGLPKGAATGFAGATDLEAFAEQALPEKLVFTPGTDFLAGDKGSDVLAAVVEKACGRPLEPFIQAALLEPLGMKDTFVLTRADDARAARAASAYVGAAGNWNRNWSPAQGPLYSFALGSQSFYSTPLDYARLLALLLDGGRAGGRTVLTPEAVRRVLTPISLVRSDTGFSGVTLRYGRMMQLLVPGREPQAAPVAFGASSPDGMLAWAWPGSDLIVLFFTQTRGVGDEIPVETLIDQVLIHPGPTAEVPPAYRPLLGKYLDTYGPSGMEEISIVYLNGHLAIDVPSQTVYLLEPPDAQGMYALTRNPALSISFVRDTHGEVTGLQRHQGGRTLEIPRVGTPVAKALLEKAQTLREGWKKYLGTYKTEQPGQTVSIVMREGSLGLLRQDQTAPLLLLAPDDRGRWHLKANPAAFVTFEENEKGEVVSFTFHAVNGMTLVRPRAGQAG